VSRIGRRVVIASGLLLLMVGAAFAVLLFAVADLRTSERRVQDSREVFATANQLERLVVDLETGQSLAGPLGMLFHVLCSRKPA
jgi:CHASE3 domain sensor protein